MANVRFVTGMTIPDRAGRYLDELARLLGPSEGSIASVILFGSIVKGGHSDISDVDVIVIVNDDCDDGFIRSLDEGICGIENKFGYGSKPYEASRPGQRFALQIANFVEVRTGMFVSHFVCRRRDIVKADFAKIFNTTPVLSRMLAPGELVLAGIFDHAKTVYGEDLLGKMRMPKYGPFDLARSLAMNILLSIGGAFLYLFHRSAAKFALEATKWSIHSSYFFISARSANIEDAARFYIENNVSKKHLERLLEMRKNGSMDASFVLATMPNVVWIHLATWAMARKMSIF